MKVKRHEGKKTLKVKKTFFFHCFFTFYFPGTGLSSHNFHKHKHIERDLQKTSIILTRQDKTKQDKTRQEDK